MTAKELGSQPAMPRAAFYPQSDGPASGGFYSLPRDGMTLRQHYAGLAMQGLCMSQSWASEQIAVFSVKQADDLLAELAKEGTEGQS